jgi:8-oxo-dGTP pyrophosphatase MutT (NUDIX family)
MPTLQSLRTALEHPSTPLQLPTVSRAAVAAVFSRDLDLLFIERAKHESDPWSGHISFPGGKAEAQDPTLLDTAIRETHEELGLDLAGAEVLGWLDEITTVSGLPSMVVRPWVFLVDEIGPLTPNEEVAEVHRIPLAQLLSDAQRGTFAFDFKGQQVTLAKVGFPGEAFLWGMTLRMLDQLLDRIDGRGIGLARLR